MDTIIKNVKFVELNTKIASAVYTNCKDDLTEYKCLCCEKNYQKKFDENLKKRFTNRYKFYYYDINNFTLLLPKGIYPYEYMDD